MWPFNFFVNRTPYFTKDEAREALLHFALKTLEDDFNQPNPRPTDTATSSTDFGSYNAKGLPHLLDQIATRPTDFEIDSDTVVYPKWTSSSSRLTLRDIISEPRQTLTGVVSPWLCSFGIRLAIIQYTLTTLRILSIPLTCRLLPCLAALEAWSPPAVSLKTSLSGLLGHKKHFSDHFERFMLTLLLTLTLKSLETFPYLRWLTEYLVGALRPTFAGYCIWFVVSGLFSDIGYRSGDHDNQDSSCPDPRDEVETYLLQYRVREESALLRMLQAGLRIHRTHSADGLFRVILLWAISSNDTHLVDYVINMGPTASTTNADMEHNSLTLLELDKALQVCIGEGNVQLMEHLLIYWEQQNSRVDFKLTSLPFAASKRDLDFSVQLQMMEIMLNHGVNVDSIDSKGLVSLHHCVDRPRLLQLLLDKNAFTEACDQEGKTPLHHTFGLQSPHLISADKLLTAGANIEAQSSSGCTPLYCAIYESESADAVSWLIEHGANVDVCGTRNPLQTAAYWGQVRIAALLLRAGADPNFSDEISDRTPLSEVMSITTSEHKKAIVELLLAHGAEPTVQALGAAIQGDLELRCGNETGITHFLIDRARRIGKPFAKATLDEAVSQNYDSHNMYVFRTLIDAGVEANVRLQKRSSDKATIPLNLACREQGVQFEDLTYFIYHGADVLLPDSLGNTPLHEASTSGSIVAVATLIAAGSSIGARNNKGQNALHLACEAFSRYANAGHSAVGRSFLAPVLWRKVDEYRDELILYLAEFIDHLGIGDLSEMNYRDQGGYQMRMIYDIRQEKRKQDHLCIVRRLLRDSAIPVHLQDHIGASAMHYACASGHLDLIELLLAAPQGSYILVDNSQRTPLFWAAENGRTEVVRALTHLPSSQTASNRGDTAVAPQYFFGELVRLVLAIYKDHRGWLPLHAAAAAGKSETVKVLLERSNVDPRITDNEGRTPLHLAELNNHFNCCALLRTAIAARTRVLEISDVVEHKTSESSSFPIVSVIVVAISVLVLVITSL